MAESDFDADFVAQHFPRRSDEAYLDTASVGLVAGTVLDQQRRSARAFERGVCASDQWLEARFRLTNLLAQDFGVGPEWVSLVNNSGDAMNALANALELETGDEVLCLMDDFPTVRLPFVGAGAQLRSVSPGPGESITSALVRGLSDRTRVVTVSHVHWVTGEVVDLSALGAAVHNSGAILVVDGAQAIPLVTPNLAHVDAYVATAYKWQIAGFGQAVMLTAPSLRDGLMPRLLGHGNEPPSRDLVWGHTNAPGVLTFLAAIELRRAYGYERIRARTFWLTAQLRCALESRGFEVTGAGDGTSGSGIVAVPTADPDAAVERLRTMGCIVTARAGHVRLSPYFYTSDAELEQAITAFELIRTTAEGHHV